MRARAQHFRCRLLPFCNVLWLSHLSGTSCTHELRSSQQRLSTAEHELAELRDDLVRTREELKALREVHAESCRSLEETRA